MSLPSTPTRRRLLAGLGAGLSAGCLGGGSASGSDPATSSPTPSNDTRTATPSPPCAVDTELPTTEFGPPYPPLSVDSAALAIDFALSFEEALQRNRVQILEPEAAYVRLDSKEATEPESVERGYLVGVRVELAYGREVHTSDDPDVESFHGTRSATAAYFVGDRAVRVRTESFTVVDPRGATDGAVVACEA